MCKTDDQQIVTTGPMVEPKFWSGMEIIAAETFTIDCGGRAPPVEEIAEEMKRKFAETGLIVVKNTGLTTLTEMEPYSQVIVPKARVYEGGANPRKGIQKNFYEVGAPESAHLHYHHEMAYVRESVRSLSFCCSKATRGTGWTFVSNEPMATKELLSTPFGQKLKEKGLCYVRCLPDRTKYEGGQSDEGKVYNFWQRSFLTEDRDEAEKRANATGLEVEWGTDPLGNENYMITKFYVSAFEYHPETDQNLCYASVADHSWWFDTWPGVMEYSHKDRPLELRFGDDTPISYEEFKFWIGLNDKYGVPVRWEVGDIVAVCNHRWTHGRPGYNLKEGEERELGVRLGEQYTRIGDLPGKWRIEEEMRAESPTKKQRMDVAVAC